MNLRPRDPSKEINPTFRYQSNNYLEKIKSVINGKNAGNSYKQSEAYSSKIKNKYGDLAKNLVAISASNYKPEERSKTPSLVAKPDSTDDGKITAMNRHTAGKSRD
jgi:hypothetical protein